MTEKLGSNEILEKFCFVIEDLIFDNYLSSTIAGGNGEAKVFFTLDIVSNCAFNERFLPDPIKYIDHFGYQVTEEHLSEFISITRMSKFHRHFHKLFITDSCTDEQYIESFAEEGFTQDVMQFIILLYFFLFTNRVTIIPIMKELNSNVWKTENSLEKLREFGSIKSETKLLFHGTSANCVYSILRNGLKCLSNTSLMTTGVRFGSGIYCSDDIPLAFFYAKSIVTRERALSSSYLLVLKVKNPHEKEKGYFVQKEDEVLICGIIEIRDIRIISAGDTELIQSIQNQGQLLFNSTDISDFEVSDEVPPEEEEKIEAPPEKSQDLLHFTMRDSPRNNEKVVTSKRFLKETKMLLERSGRDWDEETKKLIPRINFNDPNDNSSPLLVEFIPPDDTPIYTDLQNAGIPGIVLAFHFNCDYPHEPFRVRVVYPRIREGTGRVTSGGSICMSNLYSSAGWSPSITIMSIIMSIISVIPNEGQRGDESQSKGRLADNPNRSYSYQEYLSGYQIAKDFHKW